MAMANMVRAIRYQISEIGKRSSRRQTAMGWKEAGPWLALGMVTLIAAFSSYIAVRRVLKIEPFDIFRG